MTRCLRRFVQRGSCDSALFAPSLKAPGERAMARGANRASYRPPQSSTRPHFRGKEASGTHRWTRRAYRCFRWRWPPRRAAWADAERGLSPADLAMHVVLPELDGRLFAGVASFQRTGQTRDPLCNFPGIAHRPDARADHRDRRPGRWLDEPRQSRRPNGKLALVLSTYPGKTWNMAHAVGLDALASTDAILDDLARGCAISTRARATRSLAARAALPGRWPTIESALGGIARGLADTILQHGMGRPEDDPDLRRDCSFCGDAPGAALVALQPERGARTGAGSRVSRPLPHPAPRLCRVLSLAAARQCDAVVHVGAHGTLEWLPGKSVALSDECWPEALIGPMPVIYPFIVNDPGEAAQAKRRIGADHPWPHPGTAEAKRHTRPSRASGGAARRVLQRGRAGPAAPRSFASRYPRPRRKHWALRMILGSPTPPVRQRRSPASTVLSATSKKASLAMGCTVWGRTPHAPTRFDRGTAMRVSGNRYWTR